MTPKKSPRPTMEDVAHLAGVSRALVSIAYRGATGVSDETRALILAAGEELGYTPNRVAARLAGGGGDTVGVFLQDLHNDLFAEFYDGIRAVTEAAGKELVLAVGGADGGHDLAALQTLRRSRVDVIIAGGLRLSDERARRIAARVPLVCVFRAVPDVDSVFSDDRLGAEQAARHLLELGHRRIAFIANPPDEGYLGRREGYLAEMERAGLAARIVEGEYSRATSASIAARLLDDPEPPTAVFAHNDQAALGVLDTLAARGLRAGRDLSVIGYDNSSASRFPGTALSTVAVDGEALGRSAAELALRRIDGGVAEGVGPAAAAMWLESPPALVVRATTGPPA